MAKQESAPGIKKHIKATGVLLLVAAILMIGCLNTQSEPISTLESSGVIVIADTPTPAPSATAETTPFPLPTPLLLGDYPEFSPDELRSDLDELFDRLETTHPNLYAHRTKAEVDLDRQILYVELSQPMTGIEFYRRVAPLINSLGDYHTLVAPSEEISTITVESERFFPFNVLLENDRAYISHNFSGNTEIKYGTEVLEINGIPFIAYIDELKRFAPITHGRHLSFTVFWFVLGSIPEYQLKLLLPDQIEPASYTIQSLGLMELTLMASNEEPYTSIDYTLLPDHSVGVLTINDFVDIAQRQRQIFAQIQEDEIKNLIIDIRANSGGIYDLVTSIMDYLTNQPYKLCSKQYVATPGDDGYAVPREMECDLEVPVELPERFQGNIYLLVGLDTTSAAVTFATILQDYHLATLIGEETLAAASYCGNVISVPKQLTTTHLNYLWSRTCYTRPNGIRNDQGVIPDIIVESTIKDIISNKDPVLSYTLDLIQKNSRAP